ncbi:DUF4422 domain-containing protein [Candidatus Pelagibacter communis]|uniref:DUF4422 domain-containing protein n=1 Tax=Pelagibacter ubique TaxID=198252 RepID=UPI00094DE8D6|nr:DUF4422 domain-containing protein [Candidatus Pelagibacter ubique]
MKIFCISILNKNYEKFKKLNLTPVGLGDNEYDKNWLNDKIGDNISKKNLYFGEYTFHYNLWKNKNLISNHNDWIGFCTYRRFWTKSDKTKIDNFSELEKIIINKPQNSWENYDVIIGEPLIFKKIKNIKLLKLNLLEVIKKPSMLFNNNTLEDQFRVFHGSFFLDRAIDLMPKKYQNDFKKYMNGYLLYPYNMFICKNFKILLKFYDEIFPWLFKCEEAFKYKKLSGYNKIRIYGFLAERFMPFWFMKNFRTKTCTITFFDESIIK